MTLSFKLTPEDVPAISETLKHYYPKSSPLSYYPALFPYLGLILLRGQWVRSATPSGPILPNEMLVNLSHYPELELLIRSQHDTPTS